MDRGLLAEIRATLAPRQTWALRQKVRAILETQIAALPKDRDLNEAERRYPVTPSGMGAFLNAFFARHFFQVQDSILQPDVFDRFYRQANKGTLNIADIGSGPAVASLAVLDVLDTMQTTFQLPRVKINIVLNDTSAICLQTGQEMLRSLLKQAPNCWLAHNAIAVDTPFPESLKQLRRISTCVGLYHLCFMSYVLVPLKTAMTHADIQTQLNELQRYCSNNSLCIILQDKFRESLIRHVSRLQGASTHKARLIQRVYDRNNSNTKHRYAYYRTTIMPEPTPRDYGVSTRFCLQNTARIPCFRLMLRRGSATCSRATSSGSRQEPPRKTSLLGYARRS